MANLPTAHASQSFGARQIDFYAAPGLVVGSDPRARPDERRIQDNDGARHTVRLADKRFRLEPGDAASVVRLQPGPSRRSRAVAVVNYETTSWARTHSASTGLLAQAGVSRAANWLAAVAALVMAALVAAYPALRGVFAELAPGLAGALPAFDVFAVIGAQLGAWRLADSLGGLPAAIEAASPALEGLGALVAFAGLVAGGAILTFAARSWRLVWVPTLIVGAAIGAYGIAGAASALTPFLIAIGGVFTLFALGGIINRSRDAARLDRRIEQLADHAMRHPPEEYVSSVAVREAQAAAVTAQEGDIVPPLPDDEARDEARDEALGEARGQPRGEDGSQPADAAEARAEDARDIALPPPPPMPAASGFRDPNAAEREEAPSGDSQGGEAEHRAQADQPDEAGDAGRHQGAAEGEARADEPSQNDPGETKPGDAVRSDAPARSDNAGSGPITSAAPAGASAAKPGAPATGSAAADLDGPAFGAPPAWPATPLPDNVVPIFAAPPPAPPAPKSSGEDDEDTPRG